MPASHQDELIISVARNHRQVFRTNQEAYVGREGGSCEAGGSCGPRG